MKYCFLPISIFALTIITTSAISAPKNEYFISQQVRSNGISGRVIRLDGDDFILDTGNQQIKVDAKSRSLWQANLKVGDQVTVMGEFDDDDEFDARTIVRADGARIPVSD